MTNDLSRRVAMLLLLCVMTSVTTAWADAVPVNLQVDDEIPSGTAGHYFVTLSTESLFENAHTLTLTDADVANGVTSFKIYDGDGKNSERTSYPSGSDGNSIGYYLYISVPEGYYPQVEGILDFHGGSLMLYEGVATQPYSQWQDDYVHAWKSGGKGVVFDVERFISKERSITICCPWTKYGLKMNLTVTLIHANSYDITIHNSATGGSVSSANSSARFNDHVSLMYTPDEGYMLGAINVVDGNGNAVDVTIDWHPSNTATFLMPNSDVTITPIFLSTRSAIGDYQITMPKRGNMTITVPMDVASFKVYNNSLISGNYDGCLTVIAPEGYQIAVSGTVDFTNSTSSLQSISDTDRKKSLFEVYEGSSIGDRPLCSSYYRSENLFEFSHDPSDSHIVTLLLKGEWSGDQNGIMDVTLTLIPRTITVNNPAKGGIVVSDKAVAEYQDIITLTAMEDEDYEFNGISVNGNVDIADCAWYNNIHTATFLMFRYPAIVTPIFTHVDDLCVYMPVSGNTDVTIPSKVNHFKVYDNGGADDFCSSSCDGTLTLTAPENCCLELTGRINSTLLNYLTVYDGAGTSGTPLLNKVSSDNWSDIRTTVSKGRSMTLYFHSQTMAKGLDLTVTVIDATQKYSVNITNPATGGIVTSNVSTASYGEDVTLMIKPDETNGSGLYYQLSDISLVDADGREILIKTPTGDYQRISDYLTDNCGGGIRSGQNPITFTMPKSAVSIIPKFEFCYVMYLYPSQYDHNSVATIPDGMTFFKIYDNQGKDCNNYDGLAEYKETFILNAPDGYSPQIDGRLMGNKYTKVIIDNGVDVTTIDGFTDNVWKDFSSFPGGGRTLSVTITGKNDSSVSNQVGIDFSVNVYDPDQEYLINIYNTGTGGFVSCNNMATAKYGEDVTLTITCDKIEGSGGYYQLGDISLVDDDGKEVLVKTPTGYMRVADYLYYYCGDGGVRSGKKDITFTMPRSSVSIYPKFEFYYNMYMHFSKDDYTRNITIPDGITSFKIYDDHGKDCNASMFMSDYKMTYILTAPEGYHLQMNGRLMVNKNTTFVIDNGYSPITIDDFQEEEWENVFMSLPTAGRILKFTISGVNDSSVSCLFGMDLTVNLLKEYNVTINPAIGGTLSLYDNSSMHYSGERVNLSAWADDGYLLDGLIVKDVEGNEVCVDVRGTRWYELYSQYYNSYLPSFFMPGFDVVVTPKFIKASSAEDGLFINLPTKSGAINSPNSISNGITSIKIYDDGGENGNYSVGCGSSLILIAPTGHAVQLSGCITTDIGDALTVYDGGLTSDLKLLDAVSSTTSGMETAIPTVTSSDVKMMIHFKSSGKESYAGLNLTATFVPIIYTITYHLGGDDVTFTTTKNTYTVYDDDFAFDVPTRPGYVFAGWYESNRYGQIITDKKKGYCDHLEMWAQWTRNNLTLASVGTNSGIIEAAVGEKVYDVTLADRMLYAGGAWNTLCLPIDINDISETPLQGFTIKELDTRSVVDGHKTGIANGKLYLNFRDATRIKAGKPYLVQKKFGKVACTATCGTAGFKESEGFAKLVDGMINTKWCSSTGHSGYNDGWICEFSVPSPVRVTGYSLTTASDTYEYVERNPMVWTLQGKLNEGDAWTDIDSRDVTQNSNDALPAVSMVSNIYDVSADKQGTYQYFRFKVSQSGTNKMQLSELTLTTFTYSGNSLVDGDPATNWTVDRDKGESFACEFQTSYPVSAFSYTLTTASDTESNLNFRPSRWKLFGKLNESDEWVQIDYHDYHDGHLPTTNSTPKTYDISIGSEGYYRYYRLEVLDNHEPFMEKIALGELKLNVSDGYVPNPRFCFFHISDAAPTAVTSGDGKVSFVGSYDSMPLTAGEKVALFAEGQNTLIWPDKDMVVGSCHALFRINTTDDINAFVLNFDSTGSFAPGDVNGDGKVTITDVALVMEYIKTRMAPADCNMDNADVDGNDEITISDAVAILGIVLEGGL